LTEEGAASFEAALPPDYSGTRMSDIEDYAAPLPNGGLDATVSQAHEE
jgi:hypothetical protein